MRHSTASGGVSRKPTNERDVTAIGAVIYRDVQVTD